MFDQPNDDERSAPTFPQSDYRVAASEQDQLDIVSCILYTCCELHLQTAWFAKRVTKLIIIGQMN